MFSSGLWELLKKRFFYKIPLVVAFMSTRKESRGKPGKKEEEKKFSNERRTSKKNHLTSACKFWC